ncbi:MAG TPA: extracellular solute-binding protein [Alphaproteobacteria bacterium]|nr:extracellular solute-binding protein [Alphaproteobacteria bacterium]
MLQRHKLAGAAALAAMWAILSPAVAADLTVSTYGGIFETTVRECFVKPFEAETGKSVALVLGQPTQWVNQILATPASPPIDVLISNATFTFQARDKKALEKFSEDKIPNLKDVPRPMVDMLDGYGSVMDFGILGLTYDKRRVKNPPKSFQEFIDRTIKGEWKAAIPGAGYAGMPYYVIWGFADMLGGGIDNVDPAFDAIKRMKASGNLSFWSGSTDFVSQLQSGEFDIGMFFDGRTFASIDEGADWLGFVNPAPGSVMGPTTISKVANGSPLGWKFIDVALAPQPQACFADKMQYGIVNMKARPDPKVAARLVKWNETRVPPYETIGSHIAGWLERWNKEIGG